MRVHNIFFALLIASGSFAQTSTEHSATGTPVATVGGQVIFEEELAPLVEGQLRQLQYQEYLLQRKALDDLINQRLVAAKAKEKGLDNEEFLRQTVDSTLPEPNEAEVRSFYFHQRNLANLPFEQIKNQLSATLRKQNIERARQSYFESLRQSAQVSVMLKPPKVQVIDSPDRVLGNPDAPVTIVEFADYECPFCQKAIPALQELLNKYNGQVRLAYRDFPLEEIHPGTQTAAEAARCADEQGKFWAYHDALFANPIRVGANDLRAQAQAIGLDAKQFDSCLQEHKFKAKIEDDVKAGLQAGVSGTPAFFINGVFLNGLQSLSTFETIIDQELAAVKVKDNKIEVRAAN